MIYSIQRPEALMQVAGTIGNVERAGLQPGCCRCDPNGVMACWWDREAVEVLRLWD